MEVQTQTPDTRSQVEAEEFLGVLLVDPDRADVRGVAEAMAGVFGLHRTDAAMQARYSQGVITRSTEPLIAQRLIAALDQKGVGSFSVPARTFGDAPAEAHVREAILEDHAATFSLKGTAGPRHVEWSRIVAMHLYALDRPADIPEQKDRMLHAVAERIFRPGLVRVLDDIAAARAKGREPQIAFDLLCREPFELLRLERDLRITSRLTGTLAAGPGDEEGIHTLERLLRVFEEILMRSGAFLPASAHAFLDDLQLKEISYVREEERRNRNLWLWQMIRTGRLEGEG